MPKKKNRTRHAPWVPHPTGARLLELGALLALLVLCTIVLLVAGPAALAAATGVAAGLFTTWRGQRGHR